MPTLDQPVRGRASLAANVRRNKDQQERSGEQLRHWIGMLDVRQQLDGSLRTRAYALVYATHAAASRRCRGCACWRTSWSARAASGGPAPAW
ncbi:hypothetical protein [Streptomyces sp. KL116D]|uniref:hypothetical protein n=1 Tax=Streptomyces sp. KL116D TaxID=3045152 RepID=UPI00355804EE